MCPGIACPRFYVLRCDRYLTTWLYEDKDDYVDADCDSGGFVDCLFISLCKQVRWLIEIHFVSQ